MDAEGAQDNSYLKLKRSNYIKNLIILTKNIQNINDTLKMKIK